MTQQAQAGIVLGSAHFILAVMLLLLFYCKFLHLVLCYLTNVICAFKTLQDESLLGTVSMSNPTAALHCQLQLCSGLLWLLKAEKEKNQDCRYK